MKAKQIRDFTLFIFIFITTASKGQHITLLQQNKPTSIRGLCVVDNKTAWISGSKGFVALTTDGGQTWKWQQVKGYETADFRSIEAFSDQEAIIMSSGTPAVVLKTADKGVSWQLKYKNIDSVYFFDAMSFVNAKHGYILGDPILNKFLLLESKDGGENWNNNDKSPVAIHNQAAFAASGTCLRISDGGKIVVVTGGALAGIDISESNGDWKYHQAPIYQRQASKGVFSIALHKQHMVAVGGDYQQDKESDSTACYSNDFGKIWHLAKIPPGGFQSCVEYISDNTLLSTGTTGSNISMDNGLTWSKFDNTSFNVCRKSKHGEMVLFAGNNGRIAIYTP